MLFPVVGGYIALNIGVSLAEARDTVQELEVLLLRWKELAGMRMQVRWRGMSMNLHIEALAVLRLAVKRESKQGILCGAQAVMMDRAYFYCHVLTELCWSLE